MKEIFTRSRILKEKNKDSNASSSKKTINDDDKENSFVFKSKLCSLRSKEPDDSGNESRVIPVRQSMRKFGKDATISNFRKGIDKIDVVDSTMNRSRNVNLKDKPSNIETLLGKSDVKLTPKLPGKLNVNKKRVSLNRSCKVSLNSTVKAKSNSKGLSVLKEKNSNTDKKHESIINPKNTKKVRKSPQTSKCTLKEDLITKPSTSKKRLEDDVNQSNSRESGRLQSNLETTQTAREREPVWKKDNTQLSLMKFDYKRRKSLRLSKLENKDIYEFLFEDKADNDNIKKKSKQRVQIRRRKKAKTALKSGVLTTDPLFQPPIKRRGYQQRTKPDILILSNKKKISEDCSNELYSEDQHFDSVTSDFDDREDIGYDGGTSAATENGSCFFPPSTTDRSEHLFISTPKPNWSSKLNGQTSTPRDVGPRWGPNVTTIKEIIQEEVKIGFGFDESYAPSLQGLSPVSKEPQFDNLSSRSVCTDIVDLDPAPTRFQVQELCTSTRKSKTSLNRKRSRNRKVTLDEANSHCDLGIQCDSVAPTILYALPDECSLETEEKENQYSEQPVTFQNIEKSVPSPEKTFILPPKKTYDRKSLDEVKSKLLLAMAGGHPSDSEEEDSTENHPPKVHPTFSKRKKNKTKRLEKSSEAKNENSSQKTKRQTNQKTSDSSKTLKSPKITRKKKRKGQVDKVEKSLTEWASDINSHFSEIEEMDLIIG